MRCVSIFRFLAKFEDLDVSSRFESQVAARGRAEEDRQHSDAVRQRLELELTAGLFGISI
jgi:hypothetical protein